MQKSTSDFSSRFLKQNNATQPHGRTQPHRLMTDMTNRWCVELAKHRTALIFSPFDALVKVVVLSCVCVCVCNYPDFLPVIKLSLMLVQGGSPLVQLFGHSVGFICENQHNRFYRSVYAGLRKPVHSKILSILLLLSLLQLEDTK